jgi:hypothetical protein
MGGQGPKHCLKFSFDMYIFKSDPPNGEDEYLSKSSKSPLASTSAADGVFARLQPVVPAQTALLAGGYAPNALVLSNIAESIANAGAISSIGRPVSADYVKVAANELSNNDALAASLEAFSKNLLVNHEVTQAVVPIASLSDVVGSTPTVAHSTPLDLAANNATLAPTMISFDNALLDVSTLPTIGAPVVITALSDGAVTVLDSASANVHIADFVTPQVTTENFINTGSGTLTVTTAATHVSSLSLTGNVAYTALADEVTSGITVSGESDSSNVTLYLLGGASSTQVSSDFITLGNGDNFVFDAGDGQVLFNLGSGQNTVLLAGVGVTGVVNLAKHDNSTSDFVALAANGLTTAHELAASELLIIGGLNNNAQSQDAITFLSDMDSQLSWAHGTASGSQITSVAGDAASLENWISTAQSLAHAAHSVAWFQFGGNTFVLETGAIKAGDHSGETLVKLTGLTQFTNTEGDLSIGMIHLAG